MGMTKENSLTLAAPGGGEKVVVGAASSAPSTKIAQADGEYWVVGADAVMFVRKGANPTAVVDVDQQIFANQQYRVGPLSKGDKLAFYSTPGGNVWIMPSA